MLDEYEALEDPDLACRTLEAELAGLSLPPQRRAEIHYSLWELCQICGDEAAALRNLRSAIAINPLREARRADGTPERSILCIAAPGNFQTNLPIGMLLDSRSSIATLFVHDTLDLQAALSSHGENWLAGFDCVFITIAEDRRLIPVLSRAEQFAQQTGLPVINGNGRIQQMSRTGAASLLVGIDGVLVPECRELDAGSMGDVVFPVLIRPVSSHAGHALAKLGSAEELQSYLAQGEDKTCYYVTCFVDYRSADGLFRKYRIVFVDGMPHPVHMAIHDDWAVWYYNAGMDMHPERRREEERFMADMPAFFSPEIMSAFHEIARHVGLDYFGMDFGMLPDGRVVVFEIETGMIVHDRDPEDIYPYKRHYIHRVRKAVEDMIDCRKGIPGRAACG